VNGFLEFKKLKLQHHHWLAVIQRIISNKRPFLLEERGCVIREPSSRMKIDTVHYGVMRFGGSDAHESRQ